MSGACTTAVRSASCCTAGQQGHQASLGGGYIIGRCGGVNAFVFSHSLVTMDGE